MSPDVCVYDISVYKAFDTDNDGYISEEEWVLGMSTYLKGCLEEQARCKSNIWPRKNVVNSNTCM